MPDADSVEPASSPQRGAPVQAHRAESIRLGKTLDGRSRNARGRREPLDAGISVPAHGDERVQLVLVEAVNLPEAKAHREGTLRARRGAFERAVPRAEIDIDAPHFDAVLTRIAHELGRLIEAHRLAVE